MTMSVGFVGMGIMGFSMARNLLKAGFTVRVYNRTRSKAEPLTEHGAAVVDSPAEAAEGVDVIITCVSDTPDVEAVFKGDGGILQTLCSGALAIDMSTISPTVTKELAELCRAKGTEYLDAPVSGGSMGAEAGTLTIMCGGEGEAFEKAKCLFEAMGSNIVHCGPVGTGQMTKLCNQILCACNLIGVCEAMVLAKRAGLDLEKMLEATSGGAGGSWALKNLGERMRIRDFKPAFMVDLQQKDLRLVLDQAWEEHLTFPGTALVHQLLTANQAAGEGSEGTQALLKVIERLSNAG